MNLMAAVVALVAAGSLAPVALAASENAAATAVGAPLGVADIAQLAAGLALVVALIAALAWALRRLGGVPVAGRGPLQVLGGLSVGARERVVLLRVGDRQLLLGVAPGRVQTLQVLDEPVAMPPAAGGGFAGRLQRVLSGSAR